MSQSGFEPTEACPHRWCPFLHKALGWGLALMFLAIIIELPWLLLAIAAVIVFAVKMGYYTLRIRRTPVKEAPLVHVEMLRKPRDPVVVDPRWALIAAASDAVTVCGLLVVFLEDVGPVSFHGLVGGAVFWMFGAIPTTVGVPFRLHAHERASKPRPRRRRRVRVRNAKPVRLGRLAPAGA